MADIFLSYASEDADRVKPFVELFEEQGWSVWWDPHIRCGQRWTAEIEHALTAASCVVVIWTEASVRSEWVETEASWAREQAVLVPVLLEEVEVPLQFRLVEAARLTEPGAEEHARETTLLLDSIAQRLANPAGGERAGTVRSKDPTTTLSTFGPWSRRAVPVLLALGVGLVIVLLALTMRSGGVKQTVSGDNSTGVVAGGDVHAGQ